MRKTFIAILCITFIVLAFLDINAFIGGGRAGFQMFYMNVLPVLFPFFFVTSMLTEIGFFNFRPRLGVFCLSLVGGYPTSARMLAELHERGEMSQQAAIHTATFTSTASPIFVITMGATIFGSVTFGVLVFIAMVVGALLNGFLYRGWLTHSLCTHRSNTTQIATDEKDSTVLGDMYLSACVHKKRVATPQASSTAELSIGDAFPRALQSAITSIMSVGGLIVLFFIVGNQIDALLGLGGAADVVLSGTLEMTAGVFRLGELGADLVIAFIACVAILSFGGLCVAMQGFLFLKRIGMSFRFYLLYKVTHTILSVGIGLLLWALF